MGGSGIKRVEWNDSMSKVLTVVVPTYNIEKYISTCLESLCIEEIMDSLEVLIVNDGSRDCSAEIALTYVDRYPNTFRLINKENGGHGSAINAGVREATGRYFKVVDGDDWVDRTGIIALMRNAQMSDDDMIVSNYYWVNQVNGEKTIEHSLEETHLEYGITYQFEEIYDKVFVKMHAMTLKTSILKEKCPNIDEHCFYVDMEYILYPIPFVKTVRFIPEFVYMYRIGLSSQSVNIRNMQKRVQQHEHVFNTLLRYYEKNIQNIADSAVARYIEIGIAKMSCSQIKIYLSFTPSKEFKNKIIEQDRLLKRQYPRIYSAAQNKGVILLRRSHYLLYYFAAIVYGICYGDKNES